MRPLTALATLASLVALSACTTMGGPTLTDEQYIAMDQHECLAYGFRPNTDPFAECVMGRTQAREQATAQAWQDFRTKMHSLGDIIDPPRQQTCLSSSNGSVFGNTYNSTGMVTCY
jgi:hypothetical protein